MGSDYRYPFPPYPTGWYLLCPSVDVPVERVVTFHYFGRELIAYRPESGGVAVAGAHCPHMGAHLGVGGTVEGDGLRCPFHAWHFGADGWCDDVPYSTTGQVPRVCLDTWEVREHSGLVMVWFSSDGQRPTWEPPERDEFGQPGWIGYETAGWRIRMHTQELAENIPDMAHFTYVHGVGAGLRAEFQTDGHVYRQRSLVSVDGELVEFTRQEASGLGLVWLRTGDGPSLWFLTSTTPIDEEHVDLRLLFLVRDEDEGSELGLPGRLMVDATVENTSRDVPIWENKVYVERPPLVSDDGPIRELRRWACQFYPDPV